MTTKKIVYKRPDGGVSVTCPSPRHIAELMDSGMTEDDAIALVQAKDVPSGATNVEVIELSTIPASREFRNAWEKPAVGPPTVNMPKARAIHVKRISDAKVDSVIVLQKRIDEATLDDRTTDATKAANDKTAVEGLDLATFAAQIAGAANPTVLSAIWPAELQEFKP